MPEQSFDLTLLKELTGTPGVSGREQAVAGLIQRNLPAGFDCHTDPLGNLTAHLPGIGPKLLLLTHMDEVGLIVQQILPNGFIRVERIGGISVRALPGSKMDLWTETGKISAQVGILPGHLDLGETTKLSDCYIDIGANSDHEASQMGVQIGDVLTWHSEFSHLDNNLISSKALDDRLGCFALIMLADHLVTQNSPFDLTLAFSVQEETMLNGSLPVVERIKPDIAIGVDGTLCFDTPDLLNGQSSIGLGKGPVLKWMDAIRGKSACYVPDLKISRQIRKTAEAEMIPLQQEVMTGLTTAITPVPYHSLSVRTAAISIPIRYHHTAIETANLLDVHMLVELLKTLILKNCF